MKRAKEDTGRGLGYLKEGAVFYCRAGMSKRGDYWGGRCRNEMSLVFTILVHDFSWEWLEIEGMSLDGSFYCKR